MTDDEQVLAKLRAEMSIVEARIQQREAEYRHYVKQRQSPMRDVAHQGFEPLVDDTQDASAEGRAIAHGIASSSASTSAENTTNPTAAEQTRILRKQLDRMLDGAINCTAELGRTYGQSRALANVKVKLDEARLWLKEV